MTTPDPQPGPAATPDDLTTAYDAQAAMADAGTTAGAPPPLPFDPSLAAPAPAAPAPAPWSSSPGSIPPPVPTAAPAPDYASGPAAAPGWASPPPTGGPTTGWTPGVTGAPPARATTGTPPGIVAGIILVVIGAALLVSKLVEINIGGITWPLWIVVPGVAMLIGSFFIPPKGGVGLAIPGTIITIVGLILWVQDAYGLYATWAYAWALVAPTGPGLGMLLYGLVHRDGQLIGDGFRTMLVGIGLFLGFALFFEGVIGLSGPPIPNLEEILPYAVIGLGVLLVALSFARPHTDRREPHPR